MRQIRGNLIYELKSSIIFLIFTKIKNERYNNLNRSLQMNIDGSTIYSIN